MKQLTGLLLSNKTTVVLPAGVHSFIAVVHPDDCADVYVNESFQDSLEILAKNDIKAGQLVRSGDIADIRRLKADVPVGEDDKIIYCFKVEWKFGLVFDMPTFGQKLDIDRFWRMCGDLYRHVAFENVYEALAEGPAFDVMRDAGWFPFIELIGGNWDDLVASYRAQPPLEPRIKEMPSKFTDERIGRMASRWWYKKAFADKRPLIEAGLQAFMRRDGAGYINCITTLYPLIEGILRDVYFAEKGIVNGAKTPELLRLLHDKGKLKSGSDASLFLPADFFKYLSDIVFARFDVEKGNVKMSRNSAMHGVADPADYSDVRALQAVLILDQICFYL